jgi:alkanesulfonate monooxygenase SsuD/methylene tetrahydromethanopterin reductase-like flavin-dependent oxidoreductase (luciferase family)
MAISRPKAPRASRARRSEDAEANLSPIVELTPEEAWERYDARARRLLGMSAEEFEQALKRGDFSGPEENRDAVAVWMIQAPRPGS